MNEVLRKNMMQGLEQMLSGQTEFSVSFTLKRDNEMREHDESFFDVKIEKVSNDNYTKLYSLESDSPIINDTEILESSLEFSGYNQSYDFDISMETYETMNKSNNDRYEYIFPSYSLTKYIESSLEGELSFTSSGNSNGSFRCYCGDNDDGF